MRLIPDSGFRLLRGSAHWQLCALRDTARVDDVVMLAPAAAIADEGGPGAGFAGGYAGMAFDQRCRLFHPRPEAGAVDYVLWGQTSALGVHDSVPHPFTITAAGTEVDGSAVEGSGDLPQRPLALAGDSADFLYVADPDSKAVWLIDTWQQEVARRIEFEHPPLDLAACGAEVFVLLADGSSWQLGPCTEPVRTIWPAVAGERLSISAAARGGLLAWVLSNAGQFDATLHALHLGKSIAVPFCTDIASEAEDPEFGTLMIVAQRPGENFLRLRLLANQPTMLPPLMAPNYDGRGIALAPDCRVAYWTAQEPATRNCLCQVSPTAVASASSDQRIATGNCAMNSHSSLPTSPAPSASPSASAKAPSHASRRFAGSGCELWKRLCRRSMVRLMSPPGRVPDGQADSRHRAPRRPSVPVRSRPTCRSPTRCRGVHPGRRGCRCRRCTG